MIYAQIHTFNTNQTCIASRADQPDPSWIEYNVPTADWLYIDVTGAIAVHTQAEMDAIAATELIAAIDTAVQSHINAAAFRRGYADASTCVSYMNSTVAAWAADAKAMNQWRDDAWNLTIAQEALSPLPTPAAVASAVDALTSNPKW